MTEAVVQRLLAESEEADLHVHVHRLPEGVPWVAYVSKVKEELHCKGTGFEHCPSLGVSSLAIPFLLGHHKKVMGKNKAKGLKQANVFHIANKKILKAKSKTKPVATNLKKINIVNDEKVHKIDKVFTEIQRNVKQLSKTVPSDSSKKLQIPNCQEDKPANVDAAANLLSQLWH